MADLIVVFIENAKQIISRSSSKQSFKKILTIELRRLESLRRKIHHLVQYVLYEPKNRHCAHILFENQVAFCYFTPASNSEQNL